MNPKKPKPLFSGSSHKIDLSSLLPTPEGSPLPQPSVEKKRLTFPRQLLREPPSQIDMVMDASTKVVEKLDTRAQHFGTKFGVPMVLWSLKERALGPGADGWEIAAAVLVAMGEYQEFVSLERRTGRWGLYYTRQPPPLARGEEALVTPLRDAPVDVRMRFLDRSEKFFRDYLELAKKRLAEPNSSVAAGEATLALLDSVEPE